MTHSVEGRTFVYRAVQPPMSVATRAVRQLIDRFCGGSAEALVVGLVNDDVLSQRELERIARRIAQAKRANR